MRLNRLVTSSLMMLCLAVPAAGDTPEKSKEKKEVSNASLFKFGKTAPASKTTLLAGKPSLFAPKPAAAPQGGSLGTTVPKADLFLGYLLTRFNQDDPIGGMTMHGGDANVGINFRDTGWGFVLDFAGGRGGREIAPGVDEHGNLFSYLFGPRYSWRRYERIVPFVQTLFGGARADEDVTGLTGAGTQNSFAWTAGGGFDWIATPRIGWRILQAEYMMTRFDGPSLSRETQNNIRLMSGIVFRLGGAPPPPPPPNRNPSASCSASKSSGTKAR